MPKASIDELRGQIAAGEYAIDSDVLAGDILGKFEVIRRVGRWLMDPGEADAERAEPRDRRGARRAGPRRSQSRSERLS